MANSAVGELTIKVDGQNFIMQFGTYALVLLEDEMGRPFAEMLDELNDPKKFRVRTAVTFIWAGMQTHHEGMTIRDAASIFDKLGLEQTTAKLTDALVLAFPELAKKGNDGEGVADDGEGNPTPGNRKARRAASKKKKSIR